MFFGCGTPSNILLDIIIPYKNSVEILGVHIDKTLRFREHIDYVTNQNRICGKGVGLSLFPSDSLQSQLYEFIEIAHIDHTMV